MCFVDIQEVCGFLIELGEWIPFCGWDRGGGRCGGMRVLCVDVVGWWIVFGVELALDIHQLNRKVRDRWIDLHPSRDLLDPVHLRLRPQH